MFDPIFYRYLHPELANASEKSLKRHFAKKGWRAGNDPSPMFNVALYLETNPDVAASNRNPFDHYMKSGKDEGRLIFLSAWGRETKVRLTATDIAKCEHLIDADFIRSQAPQIAELSDQAVSAWFLMEGWRVLVDPSLRFSTQRYLEDNNDVVTAEVNPLLHYVYFGADEGRIAHNSSQLSAGPEDTLQADMKTVQDHFDASWYKGSYENVEGSDDDLLRHFMTVGWKKGYDPSAEFSTSYYLENHSDIATSGANPLLHYALFGKNEGRKAYEAELAHKGLKKISLADLHTVRDDFDASWYGKTYPDVEGSDEELLSHYMNLGWKEGRNPSASFSTSYYLEHYADIAGSGANPLLHYILFGRGEGRRCSSGTAIPLVKSKSANLTPELPNTGVPTFAGRAARRPLKSNPKQLDIHWVVPDFRPGSGGHMTIFRMVRFLELFGHKTTIWIEDPVFHKTPLEAWETIVKGFQCIGAEVRFVTDDIYRTSGDVVIATGWNTAWRVKDLKGFASKMYFVQDHEPEFYPTGAMSNLARQTYDFDLGCICASPWLEQLMTERYARWAQSFYLAYEPDQYQVKPPKEEPDNTFRIAVYGRSHTDRRCVQLALAALQILAQKRDDFEVHLFGQEDLPFVEAPFTAFNHGVLDPEDLSNLYNRCDMGICFSGTNYSLVPQEMMACGLPLVELDTDSTRAIFPKNVVTLAGPAPIDIAKKVEKLMDAPKSREKQSKAAMKWVQGFSWEASARQVEGAMLSYLEHTGAKLAAPAIGNTSEILFDVVVPTWNGKVEFLPVLEALRAQRIADQVQIHCIDSSSTDGTIEWLKTQKDVSLTVIDQKDFQHGRTRNFGASLGKAPFIGFITQDAMPATQDWATDIVKMMRAVPEAAGLFGRHIAYPDHPAFVREEIETHFKNMKDKPLVLSKHTDPERWASGDVGWRQFLHFYSDNNSAMRRDVWNEIPYPEVDYGEDQVWARDIIEAGYSKIYSPTATVYHSHDYNPSETYKRSKTEGAFFYEFFGYELGKGSDEKIAKQVSREQANVEFWGRRRGITDDEIDMRKDNIAEKYRGWRDGRAKARLE
jgi:glycosyltransferase involved in cell wall biosynthesis/GT2 family glycosyltransferase